jgi:DNA-binding NtrC family response regulator
MIGKERLLKTAIKNIILEILTERRKKRKKPGGGLTNWGAKRRVQKLAFTGAVKGALDATSGDVKDAADRLDISPRTLYGYLEDEPSLQRAKERAAGDDDEDEKDSSFRGKVENR